MVLNQDSGAESLATNHPPWNVIGPAALRRGQSVPIKGQGIHPVQNVGAVLWPEW